ncbi:hypothetical protein K5549_005068 [Capra hircus]|nr:hypothetical protein K5549_005068 [Capra hircus]
MEKNQMMVTEFILRGFCLGPRIHLFLFGLFSLFYVLTLLGNRVILELLSLDCRLHTPMYFFLSHLAIIDMAYACSTVPQMLVSLLSPAKPISFAGCITQTFLFLSFAHTMCLLLVVMSYDRWRVGISLVGTSWAFGSLLALVHLGLVLRLPFCGPHEINHFFCEILYVLKLACADTRLNQLVLFAASMFVLVRPLRLVLGSYACILASILRIQSTEGRRKAFSTCSSHLCMVGAIVMSMAPKSRHPEEHLRSKEVKGALRRALFKKTHF